ncbi:hypothetical protein ACP70R_017695 [Stipagrostis hirtigluma subsp. patula]
MADEGFIIPDDAFVQILVLLPTSSRRRFRLVCRRWRSLIDERTPERQVRTSILAFIAGGQPRGSSRAIVFGDGGQGGRRRGGHEWTFWSYDQENGAVHMVGTCNGLLCLRDAVRLPLAGSRIHSTITVVNPITGEKAVVPPEPWSRRSSPGRYSFAYHPTTGKYKVVHATTTGGQALDTVLVHTLGDSAWREVPVLAADWSYSDAGGLVSVDGSTYWLTARADRVVALDLGDDERVTSFETPPVLRLVLPGKNSCQLTSVHARLGVVVTRQQPAATRVDVWALERGGDRPLWSRRYSLLQASSADQGRWITSPHLTQGEHVLCEKTMSWWRKKRLYRRKVGGSMCRRQDIQYGHLRNLFMKTPMRIRLLCSEADPKGGGFP